MLVNNQGRWDLIKSKIKAVFPSMFQRLGLFWWVFCVIAANAEVLSCSWLGLDLALPKGAAYLAMGESRVLFHP